MGLSSGKSNGPSHNCDGVAKQLCCKVSADVVCISALGWNLEFVTGVQTGHG